MRLPAGPSVFVIAAVVVLTGCGGCASTAGGVPISVESSAITSGSAAEVPRSGTSSANSAPKVINPVEPGMFATKPCELLKPAQLRALGFFTPGETTAGTAGVDCAWKNLETGAGFGIQFDTTSGNGLSGAYAIRSRYAFWQEIPSIEGLPAVAFGFANDRAAGHCAIWIGLTDQITVLASGVLSHAGREQGKDPCQALQTAVGMAVRTMKGEA